MYFAFHPLHPWLPGALRVLPKCTEGLGVLSCHSAAHSGWGWVWFTLTSLLVSSSLPITLCASSCFIQMSVHLELQSNRVKGWGRCFSFMPGKGWKFPVREVYRREYFTWAIWGVAKDDEGIRSLTTPKGANYAETIWAWVKALPWRGRGRNRGGGLLSGLTWHSHLVQTLVDDED